jgi:mannose-6-phosphate isomerase-like protein (cupin superfamily)
MTTTLESDKATGAVTAIGPVGDHHQANWVVNSLMVERATAEDTGGLYSVWEMLITSDGNPPPHMHDNEDEALLVLEGSVDVTVGDVTTSVGPGGFAFAPRGVPHVFAVTSDVARLVVIANPSGAEQFFRAAGEPARAMTLPTPQPPDVAALVDTAAHNNITIFGPPAE